MKHICIKIIIVLFSTGNLIAQTNCKFSYKFEPTDSTNTSCFFSTLVQKCDFVYPAEAAEKHIEGRVYLTFELSANCDVTDIKILRGLGYGLDEIAINIVKELAKDIKEKKNCCASPSGKPIKIPITFKIAS
jgi:TonB family protein